MVSLTENMMHYISIFGTGTFIGYFLLIVRAVFMWVIRKNGTINSKFLSFIQLLLVHRAYRKIKPFGLEAVVYHPIIDGKKITVQNFIENDKLNYRDPLILEQDRELKNLAYSSSISSNLIFFNNSDYSVKGFFHHLEIHNKTVYSAAIILKENEKNG